MPLYTIWRHVDPSLTDVELEALLSRAIGSTAIYPGVLWQRSYQWDGGDQLHSLCVYEAPSIAAIEQHLRRCAVPFSETREVTEVFAEDHVPPQLNQPPPGSALFVITRTMPPGTTAAELDAAIFRSASCMGGVPGISWERSFWDEERNRSRCVYRATNPELIRQHAELSRIPCDEIQEVTEQLPSNWADWFDAHGLPHHWEQTPAAPPKAEVELGSQGHLVRSP